MENINWNIIGDDNIKRKFIIPIKSKKKWWQFWKEDESIKAKKSLDDLMSMYKEDIKLPEQSKDKVYFSNPEVNEAFIRDMEDPEVYTPGKPIISNKDGSIKFYKSYWLVTDNNKPDPNIECLDFFNPNTGEINFFAQKLK